MRPAKVFRTASGYICGTCAWCRKQVTDAAIKERADLLKAAHARRKSK